MEDKWWKLGPVASIGLFIFGVLLAVLHFVVLTNLYPSSIGALVAGISMLMIVFGVVLTILVLPVLATIEIFGSKKLSSMKKVVWLVAIWVFFNFLVAIAYYFIDRKNTI